MPCLTINKISEKKYRELIDWCQENIDGFDQTMLYGKLLGESFFDAKIFVPTLDDATYFMLVWSGEIDG